MNLPAKQPDLFKPKEGEHIPVSKPGTLNLRPYQIEAIDALKQSIRTGHKTVILQLATGGGKTSVAAQIIFNAMEKGKRALFLATRRELVYQASERFTSIGVENSMIMAGETPLGRNIPCQVASFDTLHARGIRSQKMAMPPADIVIVDECRLSIAPSRLVIVQHYQAAGAIVIGLDATPCRGDGKGLGPTYDDLVLSWPVRRLMDEGYLVNARYITCPAPDLKRMPKDKDGDYQQKELGKRMDKPKLVGQVVDQWFKHAMGKQTVVFCVTRSHARHVHEEFLKRGCKAEYLDGETEKDERKAILNRMKTQESMILVNVFVCLDDKTEILTRSGWKGRADICMDDEVANWQEGRIWFSPVRKIMQRPVEPGERMVTLHTRNRSFRVTEGHKMLWSSRLGGEFLKVDAKTIAGKAGHLPVSGVAEPDRDVLGMTPGRNRARRVAGIAYVLRQQGLSREASLEEAKRRVANKDSRIPALVQELSLDDCWLIGFWIGDGSRYIVKDGSVRYTFSQSEANAKILEILKQKLSGYDFRCVSKRGSGKKPDSLQHVIYVPRGTGGGSQERRGFYRLDRHLQKNLPDTAWCFTDDQLDAFMDGLWMADGNHARKSPLGRAIWIGRKVFADRLQALLVCRGYKSTVRRYKNGDGILYRLSYVKRETHACTKHRPKFEPSVPGEMVWCVESESGNIITRRDGYVTVMGNCTYGLDIPSLEVAVLARPTKNISLYFQIAGRVLRPSEGKTHALIIDHSGAFHEHGPLDAYVPWSLKDTDVREAKKKAEKKAGTPKDIHCKECGTVFRGRRDCPFCGHQMVLPGKPIPIVEGDLHEVDAGMAPGKAPGRRASMEDKIAFYGMLRTLAAQRKWSAGRIAHLYRSYFDTWPNDERIKSAPLMEPNKTVNDWVKHQNIKYFRSKGQT